MPGFGKRGQAPGAPPSWTDAAPAAPPSADDMSLDEPAEERSSWVGLLAGVTLFSMVGLVAGAVIVLAVNYLPWLISQAVTGDSGGVVDADYVSPLDATCGKGWTKDLPNGKQLRCYLTTKIERLCQPEEQRHLVLVMQKYSEDAAAFQAAFTVSSLSMIAKIPTQGLKLGYLSAKVQHENDKTHPDEQKILEDMKEIGSAAADLNSGPNEVMKRAKDLVPEYELVNDVKVLMLKDLIATADFGRGGNPLVAKAEREIMDKGLKVKPYCFRPGKSG